MGNLGIYFLFLIPPLVIGFWIQHRLKTTVAKQMAVPVANAMTGEQVARSILDHNGLTDVPVNPAPGLEHGDRAQLAVAPEGEDGVGARVGDVDLLVANRQRVGVRVDQTGVAGGPA